jgi:hypothetical protein
MLFMSQRESAGVLGTRVQLYCGACMAAAIAMHLPACGPICVHRTGWQPVEKWHATAYREKIF